MNKDKKKQFYQTAKIKGNGIIPFVIPVSHLDKGYRIKVFNAAKDPLLKGQIKFD